MAAHEWEPRQGDARMEQVAGAAALADSEVSENLAVVFVTWTAALGRVIRIDFYLLIATVKISTIVC